MAYLPHTVTARKFGLHLWRMERRRIACRTRNGRAKLNKNHVKVSLSI